jgi:hypothetical protein
MHLASDYIHPYKDAGGRPARCRVRIYLPDDVLDAPVVVVAGFEHRLSWRKVAAFQSGSPIFQRFIDTVGLFRLCFSGAPLGLFLSPDRCVLSPPNALGEYTNSIVCAHNLHRFG